MSKAKQILSQAAFISQIMGALIELGKQLYVRHRGDPVTAKADIRRIPDYWASSSVVDAEVDAEMAALKAQGK